MDWPRAGSGRRQPSPLRLLDVDEARAAFATSLSLRNACVAFHDDRHSMHRAHIVTRNAEALASPIVLHGFSEYALGYQRLLTARPPAGAHEQAAFGPCWRRRLGVGIPVSHPTSIYHQLFHAVPSWLAAAHLGTDVPAFVPLTFASAAIGHGKPAAPRRWHGWELSVRALTRAAAADVASATAELLLRAPCVCFDRFEATAAPFNPGALASALAVRSFRDAVLSNLQPPHPVRAPLALTASPPSPSSSSGADVLLIRRLGARRALSNEAALWARLEPSLGPSRLRRVSLEAMPLGDQMRLVAAARVLVAVHGQALAWLTFLPSERRRCAAVEISIASRRGAINGCYEAWAAAMGVRYYRAAGRLSGGCNGGATARDNEAQAARKMLNCNVTIDVAQVAAATVSAAAWTTAPDGGAG